MSQYEEDTYIGVDVGEDGNVGSMVEEGQEGEASDGLAKGDECGLVDPLEGVRVDR
jgi:hypothetical protein